MLGEQPGVPFGFAAGRCCGDVRILIPAPLEEGEGEGNFHF